MRHAATRHDLREAEKQATHAMIRAHQKAPGEASYPWPIPPAVVLLAIPLTAATTVFFSAFRFGAEGGAEGAAGGGQTGDSSEIIEERLRILQIGHFEAFCEPAIDRS